MLNGDSSKLPGETKDRLAQIAALIRSALAGECGAEEFSIEYIRLFKGLRNVGDALFPSLDRLFADSDAFTEDAELRAEQPEHFIGRQALLESAREALTRLETALVS